MLAGGPVATVELRHAANAHGHAWRTLQRIKDDLGVVATKAGFQGSWSWRRRSRRAPSATPKDASMIELGGLWADAVEMGLASLHFAKERESRMLALFANSYSATPGAV